MVFEVEKSIDNFGYWLVDKGRDCVNVLYRVWAVPVGKEKFDVYALDTRERKNLLGLTKYIRVDEGRSFDDAVTMMKGGLEEIRKCVSRQREDQNHS